MASEISLLPLESRFLSPYYTGFTESVTRYQMAEPFRNPGEAAQYFRACREREAAGYSLVRIIADAENGFIGSVEANALIGPVPSVGIWVCEQFRGLGYGKKALSMLIGILRDEGYRYALYETDIRNESSLALLKHFPYSESSEEPETVPVNESKTLLLKKYIIRL